MVNVRTAKAIGLTIPRRYSYKLMSSSNEATSFIAG
jgi:hypothetical protein